MQGVVQGACKSIDRYQLPCYQVKLFLILLPSQIDFVWRDPRVSMEENQKFLRQMENYFSQPDEHKMEDVRAELSYQVILTWNFNSLKFDFILYSSSQRWEPPLPSWRGPKIIQSSLRLWKRKIGHISRDLQANYLPSSLSFSQIFFFGMNL